MPTMITELLLHLDIKPICPHILILTSNGLFYLKSFEERGVQEFDFLKYYFRINQIAASSD